MLFSFFSLTTIALMAYVFRNSPGAGLYFLILGFQINTTFSRVFEYLLLRRTNNVITEKEI